MTPPAQAGAATAAPLRIVVIGTSGSGKTTLCQALATAHGIPAVEMDALHWTENWQARPTAEFRALVAQATQGPQWVADGNYTAVRDIVWSRATHVVWLDYSRWTVMRRIVSRTIRRLFTREVLWGVNRESWRITFFSRESILVWSWQGVEKNRQRYTALRESGEYPNLQWHVLRHPREISELFIPTLE